MAVKDVLFEPVRKTQDATHFKAVVGPDGSTGYEPCSPGEPDAFEATLMSLADAGYSKQVLPPKITMGDFNRVRRRNRVHAHAAAPRCRGYATGGGGARGAAQVLLRARPTVSPGDLEVHTRFTREFGEKG